MIRRVALLVLLLCVVLLRNEILAAAFCLTQSFIQGSFGVSLGDDFSSAIAIVQLNLDLLSTFIAAIGLYGAFIQLKLITKENERRRREEVLFEDIPDANFRAYLRNLHKELFNDDPRVPPLGFTSDELKQVKHITITGQPIATLEGIGMFTELTELLCGGIPITDLNVMGMKKLTRVSAPNCRNLENVNCMDCESLYDLELSGSPVKNLDCSGTSVDVTKIEKLTSLQTLICRGVFQKKSNDPTDGMLPISKLDLTSLTQLQKLDCSGNAISQLTNIPSSLQRLNATSNPLITEELYTHRHAGFELPALPEGITCRTGNPAVTSDWIKHLKALLNKAIALRHTENEPAAFDLLIYLWAEVRDSNIINNYKIQRQQDIEILSLAFMVIVEFGATSTQRSLQLHDWRWHGVDISLSEDIKRRAAQILKYYGEANLDLSPIKEAQMRATNSLGLAYQRPFILLHNSQLAIKNSSEAFAYFLEEGKRSAHTYQTNKDIEIFERVFNTIRYCSNFPTAFDNRGMDIYKEVFSRPLLSSLLGPINPEKQLTTYELKKIGTAVVKRARKHEIDQAKSMLNHALNARTQLINELIVPMISYTDGSIEYQIRYYRALWLQAGTYQNLGRMGDIEAMKKAEETYMNVIEGLKRLEGIAIETNKIQACSDRLGAQFGLSWLYINTHQYQKACELAKATYEERSQVLGAEHVDTQKALRALLQAESAQSKATENPVGLSTVRRYTTPLLRVIRNALYKQRS